MRLTSFNYLQCDLVGFVLFDHIQLTKSRLKYHEASGACDACREASGGRDIAWPILYNVLNVSNMKIYGDNGYIV